MKSEHIETILILKHGSMNEAQRLWVINDDYELNELGWSQEEMDYIATVVYDS